jgi:translation machinery-associated protein 16
MNTFHEFVVDLYRLFFKSIPEGGTLTLDGLHSLVRDIWLTRHEAELQQEGANRRKGRPKSVKETKLEEIKFREAEDYRTGMGSCLCLKPFFELTNSQKFLT